MGGAFYGSDRRGRSQTAEGRDLDRRDLQGDEKKAHVNNPEHEVCFLIISCGETSTWKHLQTWCS